MLKKFNWIIIRFVALLILAAFLIDIEFIILNLSFIFLHINLGIKTIVQDYIHVERVNLLSLILIRVCYIELIRYSMELLM
uniref:Sdh4 n=1 Tax=Pterocladia lucida TaxID=31408 RepID=A0A6M3WWE6_PTELU|nr:Sdh4 [Pterocladia lucida]